MKGKYYEYNFSYSFEVKLPTMANSLDSRKDRSEFIMSQSKNKVFSIFLVIILF